MSWALGYDENWKRDIGYGVPAYCDHPGCGAEIDRGLSHVCGDAPYGGEYGCGLFFCSKHLARSERRPHRCSRCQKGKTPFKPTPDHVNWVAHKLDDESWAPWRAENPQAVEHMRRDVRRGTTGAKP